MYQGKVTQTVNTELFLKLFDLNIWAVRQKANVTNKVKKPTGSQITPQQHSAARDEEIPLIYRNKMGSKEFQSLRPS